MANAAQKASWDGPGGERWAREAERYDRMSRGFLERIVTALAPRPGERVLDVGCGNGALSLALAGAVAPDGVVTGLDISTPMLELARERARGAGVVNVDFEQGDAQTHDLPTEAFDAVVSRFGVMFFEDPLAAFANLARGLRPDGRVVFTCWRELLANDWIMVPAAAALEHVPMPELGEAGGPGPFSLADEEKLRSLLAGAGLVDVEVEDIRVPLVMGTDVDDALDFMKAGEMAEILLTDVDPEPAARAWDTIRTCLEAHSGDGGVTLDGSAWLVNAKRAT